MGSNPPGRTKTTLFCVIRIVKLYPAISQGLRAGTKESLKQGNPYAACAARSCHLVSAAQMVTPAGGAPSGVPHIFFTERTLMTFDPNCATTRIKSSILSTQKERFIQELSLEFYEEYVKVINDVTALKQEVKTLQECSRQQINRLVEQKAKYADGTEIDPFIKGAYITKCDARLTEWDKFLDKKMKSLRNYLHKKHGADLGYHQGFDGAIIEALLEIGREIHENSTQTAEV